MRIKILSSAVEDLHAGRLFYENQGEGVGVYFFDSLFSDIDSLAIYPASTRKYTTTTGCYLGVFPMLCTTCLKTTWRWYCEYLTCADIPTEFCRL